MAKSSKYTAKQPDASGYIAYTEEEHAIWHDLIEAQTETIKGKACPEYLDALGQLQLPRDRIPQCSEVSKVLMANTGWQVAPVPALINFTKFFQMLNDRIFPAASFIRSRSEMHYLQEPDIFHEIFGHTPLLIDPRFAAFTHKIGTLGISAKPEYHVWLARLYWMTVEFGLINSDPGLRVYGAGLVSSNSEISYALESKIPQRKPMDVMEALRTPYRIDIHQTVYFVIDSFDQLFDMAKMDLIQLIDEARGLGLYPPTFPPKKKVTNLQH